MPSEQPGSRQPTTQNDLGSRAGFCGETLLNDPRQYNHFDAKVPRLKAERPAAKLFGRHTPAVDTGYVRQVFRHIAAADVSPRGHRSGSLAQGVANWGRSVW
jgi:hypothetical protein